MIDNFDTEEFLEWADSLYSHHPIREHAPTWFPEGRIYLWVHPKMESQIVFGLQDDPHMRIKRLMTTDAESPYGCGVKTREGELWLRTDPYRLEEDEVRVQAEPAEVYQFKHRPTDQWPDSPYTPLLVSSPPNPEGFTFRTTHLCPRDGIYQRLQFVLLGQVALRSWLLDQPEIRQRFLDRHRKPSVPERYRRNHNDYCKRKPI